MPIASLNQVALQTLAYARSIARGPDDVVNAVHITDDPEQAEDAAASSGKSGSAACS